MSLETPLSIDPALYPAGTAVERGGSAVAWSAVAAGSVTIIATTLIMLVLGAGFGLAEVSAWPGVGPRPTSFDTGAGIWLVVTQWASAAVGGYIAGRLRTRWHGLHTHEVMFRDTAHGLLAWASATIVVVGVAVLVSALTSGSGTPDVEVSAATADAMRRAAAAVAIVSAVAMLVGAFIASVSAAIGGGLRDRHP